MENEPLSDLNKLDLKLSSRMRTQEENDKIIALSQSHFINSNHFYYSYSKSRGRSLPNFKLEELSFSVGDIEELLSKYFNHEHFKLNEAGKNYHAFMLLKAMRGSTMEQLDKEPDKTTLIEDLTHLQSIQIQAFENKDHEVYFDPEGLSIKQFEESQNAVKDSVMAYCLLGQTQHHTYFTLSFKMKSGAVIVEESCCIEMHYSQDKNQIISQFSKLTMNSKKNIENALLHYHLQSSLNKPSTSSTKIKI